MLAIHREMTCRWYGYTQQYSLKLLGKDIFGSRK
ncbi:hypothetical protein WJ66_00486 [Stenotrophomonas maltophilia WJ66]|nr:hypothetical protein WJ66_00486 [Stenotrophomonas maltophilia WJ66]